MHVPALFACPLCLMQTPFALFLSLSIGGPFISYCFLRPFVVRVSRIWGWPHLNKALCVSALPLLVWPCLFCWVGLQTHTISRVICCTGGLVLCAVYLWLRGCWLLEQCHIVRWFSQILFLGVLGPGLLVVGTIVGQGVVGLIVLAFLWPSMAIQFFLECAVVGAIPMILLYGGFRYVLGERTGTTGST
jgi:hypothetical protein